jgi:hypothetical protein
MGKGSAHGLGEIRMQSPAARPAAGPFVVVGEQTCQGPGSIALTD